MSLTSTWIFLKRNQNYFWPIVAILLAFAAGAQVGKVTSPYYAAHPIVFSDSCSAACASPQASPGEQLNTLLEESRALQEAKASETPQPAVAGVSDAQGRQFVGSVNSNLYHDPGCSSASRIKEANQVWFASREEAESSGYSPSQCTKEKLGL